MSSKNKQNRPKTILTIVEGGERTYIHPYSYYEDSSKGKNKIRFLNTPEFKVDQEESETSFLYYFQVKPLRRAWNIVRRFWNVSRFLKFRLSGLRYFKIMWGCTVPVYCADIYRDCTITTPGTLTPSHAGSKLTESYYLIPSQERLKRKMREWLCARDTDKVKSVLCSRYNPFVGLDLPVWMTHHEAARNSYLTWSRKQVELGRKIAFLSSLDT